MPFRDATYTFATRTLDTPILPAHVNDLGTAVEAIDSYLLIQKNYHLVDYGGVGDAVEVEDGVVSADGLTLDSATAAFPVGCAGMLIVLSKPSVAVTNTHTTTIATRVSSSQVTLTVAAATNLRGESDVLVAYGTDNVTALNDWATTAAAAGGAAIFDPGAYLSSSGGTAGSGIYASGFCVEILDNLHIRGYGTASQLICGEEGGNPLCGYARSNWSLEDFSIDCLSFNVGGIKPYSGSHALVRNVGVKRGRIAHDILTMSDINIVDCYSEADAWVTTANSDTRGLSIANNGVAPGATDGVRVVNYCTVGYYSLFRVVNDTADDMKGVALTNLDGHGLTYAGTLQGLSIEKNSTGAVEVVADQVVVRTAQYGLQLLKTTGVRIRHMTTEDTENNGAILWAATGNTVQLAARSYNAGGGSAPGIGLRDTGGVGSTGNTLVDCAATKDSGSVYSVQESDTLTGYNAIRGGVFDEYVDVKGTTRVDTTVGGTQRLVKEGLMPSAQAITTNGATVALRDIALVIRIAPDAARTGGILSAGSWDGQIGVIRNEATAANTWTMAAAGTSHVFGGTGVSIAGGTQQRFTWWASDSLWHPD